MPSAHKSLTQSSYVTIELCSAIVYQRAELEEVHGEIDTFFIYDTSKIMTSKRMEQI